MRRIGSLPDRALAARFVDYLTTCSIEGSSDSGDSGFDVWIRDEKDVKRAREELARFEANPDAEEFDVSQQASRLRRERAAEQTRKLRRRKSLERKAGEGAAWRGGVTRQRGTPVTVGIIVIAVLIGFATNMGNPIVTRDGRTLTTEAKIFRTLTFVDWGTYTETGDGFASLKAGQVWRLVTPMFLHGDAFHLAFNMIMLYVLGSALERIHGSLLYGGLILGTQIVGMLVQVLLPDWFPEGLRGSFNAIGASGAVFGLFGFLWVRPNFEPSYPIQIPPTSVVIMIGWLLICMTPLIQGIANGAHLGGLLAGMAAAAALPRGRK